MFRYENCVRTLAAVITLTALVACDNSKITSINVDPNRPTDAPAGAVFTNAAQAEVGRWFGGYSETQTELVAQHLAKAQYTEEDRYTRLLAAQTQGWFTGPYSNTLENMRQVVKKGKALNAAGIYAPAQIMQVLDFSYITDTFGDTPYSQALAGDSVGGSLTPIYDTQQSIYTGLFATLTSAAKDVAASTDAGLGKADIIYGGNVTKWAKFANSLHARLALRIVNVDPATADKELRGAIAGGLMNSNGDNAQLKWPGDGIFDNPWAVNFKTRDDHRISKTLMDILQGNADPRLAIYAQPIANGTYVGAPNGLSTSAAAPFVAGASRPGAVLYPGATVYGTYGGKGSSTPSLIMSYAEVQFILAEAAERGIAGLTPALAQGYYKGGVTASIQQWSGLSGQPVAQSAIDAYLAQPAIAYAAGTDGLKQIALQRWIALFTDGGTAWAEYRRTCQPALVPGPAALTTYIPRRFYYPTTETSANGANLNAAITRQGVDNFSTRIWWNSKPTAAPTCN